MFDARNVYALIAAVQGDLAKVGIGKGRKNVQQGYAFRGIDDVYNVLASLLAQHGLVILPRIVSREVTERQTKSGTLLFNVVVEAEFDFVSAHDGSQHCVRTFGEAMDSADKATNKAMSAAYKYMALMTFAIPTEGDNDADQTTHDPVVPAAAEVQPMPTTAVKKAEPVVPAVAAAPLGFNQWWLDLQAVADNGQTALAAAWQTSDPLLKRYVAEHYKAAWEKVKAQAKQVTA